MNVLSNGCILGENVVVMAKQQHHFHKPNQLVVYFAFGDNVHLILIKPDIFSMLCEFQKVFKPVSKNWCFYPSKQMARRFRSR